MQQLAFVNHKQRATYNYWQITLLPRLTEKTAANELCPF
jgi:hypothetical protein